MKAGKIILIVVGSILILLNLLAYLTPSHIDYPDGADKTAILVGYYIGKNLLLVVGTLLLLWAYRINKKQKKNKEKAMIDDFLKP